MTHGQRIRIGVGIILVMGMVIVSSVRMPAWAFNATLWEAAVETTPNLARPHLNYAMALLPQGAREAGVSLLVRASELSPRGARGAEIRAAVRQELRWLAAFGDPVCSRPNVQPHC